MNNRKPRPLTQSKFPGMTREEYDARLNFVRSLCFPRMRVGPALGMDGLPVDPAGMLANVQAAVKRLGASAFGGMYRKPERPKTQAREIARRLRQRGVAGV